MKNKYTVNVPLLNVRTGPGLKYDKLSFVYINLKDKNNYVIDFNEKLKQEYENRLLKICTAITSDSWYQRNSNSCARCEYEKICK